MRTGAEALNIVGSVVAAQHTLALVIARRVVPVIIAVCAMVAIAIAVAGDRAFAIHPMRRPVAGTGRGRALVDVIVLLRRIGQAFMDPAAAGIAARGDRDRRGID